MRVSSGRLIYAGLRLKSGQCSLHDEPWLVVDRFQPFEDQLEIFRRALAGRTADEHFRGLGLDLKGLLALPRSDETSDFGLPAARDGQLTAAEA
ncbi:MAG: hypothetical protein LBU12_01870 [Deltaproteobacteria bacterium]|nr:hypothetical protein [Deltaproteobacteria bacterium]